MRQYAFLLFWVAGLMGCDHGPPSPEAVLAERVVTLAQTRGRSKSEAVEAVLRLSEEGLRQKSPASRETSILSWDPDRADARFKYVIVDNIDHGNTHQQEISIVLAQGFCMTAEAMRNASRRAPQPYRDYSFLHPGYRPPAYDLEFVIADRYPDDQRKILVAGQAPCFSVLVVQKLYGGADSSGKPE